MVWRISDRATFQALRASRRRARRGPVQVVYVPGDDLRFRVAYAVGRRSGGAVVRNRIRRRLRAAVGQAGHLAPGAYLVSAGPAAADMGFEELTKTVVQAMTQAAR